MLSNLGQILHKPPQLLISVTSVDEAKIALDSGADIIDLKNPHAGALGALPPNVVLEIAQFVKYYSPQTLTSATIGDVPMHAHLLETEILAMAKTAVDFIKIGFFEMDDYQPCINSLQHLTQNGLKLIAVLFAEYTYPEDIVLELKRAGFVGVMLDTAYKNGRTLLDYHPIDALQFFTQKVRDMGLLLGYAGSLKLQHIVDLKPLNPTYLGFRGGACESDLRTQQLNAEKIYMLKSTLAI